MRIRLESLKLQCRKSQEIIKFSPQISYFNGQISAGKSSIARLVDYCLGGNLERTPAIEQELVSVQLLAYLEDYEVLFERKARESSHITVTWRDQEGNTESVLAPIQASPSGAPIWGNEVYNISDLLFYFFGLSPIKVRKSERTTDSKLIRLSFRDIFWYCYLEQSELDSSFFNLDKPIIQNKSRYAMRFIVGAYTEKMNELEIERSKIKELRTKKTDTIKQLLTFLEQFGYNSDIQINAEIEQVNTNLDKLRSKYLAIREGYTKDTHFVDELREQLRQLNKELSQEEQVLSDLRTRIEEQASLREELIASKFKLARSTAARLVLADIPFKFCPNCGTPVDHVQGISDICSLCKQHPVAKSDMYILEEETVRQDIDSRIKELDESLMKHKKAQNIQELKVSKLRQDKALLDKKLDEELKNYDSRFLAQSRDIERQIASHEERIRNLKKTLEMPMAVARLGKEVDTLFAKEEGLKRTIQKEKESIEATDKHLQEIEDAFLQAMLAVGVPGIGEQDIVEINSRTWIPDILVGGNRANRWNFYNAGSAGKKTLINVCYALAVHKVASLYNLPLPTLLIIDTPMKNIGEDVNREIFEAFYSYLYELAQGPLSKTQFIIIDKEYFPPRSEKINIMDRYMTTDDDNHPPLISYYHGP